MMQYTKFSKGVQAALLVLMLLTSLLTGNVSNVQAQSSAPDLFTDAGDLSGLDAAPDPVFVSRSRFVSVNTSALLDSAGNALNTTSLPEVTLNLFPDATFTGVVSSVKKDQTTSTWIGTLKDVEHSYFYMVIADGVFIAHVGSTSGIYEVSTSKTSGTYKVIQIDQSKLVDEAPGTLPAPTADASTADFQTADLSTAGLPASVPGASADLSAADTAGTIDVMVVYTTAAREAEGSTAAMKARIELAMTETNTAYANSGVTPRLRLVHVQELDYEESGNLTTEVNRLASTSDGYMDSVHSLRTTFGADMVSLVVENGGGWCGMAKAIKATAASAFQVVARDGCMTGYYSFAHEFGHLQGARHDFYADPTTYPYAYGHGYVNTGSTADTRWRTIMAYDEECSDLGYTCTRLQYFSNPTNTYNTAAMDVAGTSEVYRVLNATAYTIANFRARTIYVNFTSSFTDNASGWTPVQGNWGLTVDGYYYTYGSSGYYASSKRTGVYGDLTYTVKMKRNGSDKSRPSYLIIRGDPNALDKIKRWKPSYMFGYTNKGYFSVWKVGSDGVVTMLKNWTLHSSIVKGGWNTLQVVAVGSSLKFYINGVLVFNGREASYKTGQVGFNMYRVAGTTGDALYVDYATLSTTATADFNPYAKVVPGKTVSGGNINKSP